jgi:hypothetical protein
VEFSFLKRLSAGFAIAMPLAYWFATAPMRDLAPRTDLSALAPSPVSQVRLVSTTTDGHNLVSFAEAFQTQASDLLWSGTLPLNRQSPDTIENVRLAADAVNMTAVRPNEIFSFNDIVGVRSEEKGYRPGLMYSNGEVVMGVGGGICIASTALYKAALESGFKILERHPHSGPVSYADPGRDAAVSYGWADMRFKNTTGGMLLVRAAVRDSQLFVAMYGKKTPGRTVEIATEDFEPVPYRIVEKEDITIPEGQVKVQEKARDGYSITTVRLIKQDGKLVSREVVSRDTVPPRNKVVLVPPKHDVTTPDIALPMTMPGQTQSVSTPLPLPSAPALPAPSLPTSDRTDSKPSE